MTSTAKLLFTDQHREISSLYITHTRVKELARMVLVVWPQAVSGQVNTVEAPNSAAGSCLSSVTEHVMCFLISLLQALCPALPVTSSNPVRSWNYEASLWVQSFLECCIIEVLNHRSSSSSGQAQVSSDSSQSTVDQTDQVTVQCSSLCNQD